MLNRFFVATKDTIGMEGSESQKVTRNKTNRSAFFCISLVRGKEGSRERNEYHVKAAAAAVAPAAACSGIGCAFSHLRSK